MTNKIISADFTSQFSIHKLNLPIKIILYPPQIYTLVSISVILNRNVLILGLNFMSKQRVLVTGGAGYIGSHTCKLLATEGYDPIVVDNQSTGNKWSVK